MIRMIWFWGRRDKVVDSLPHGLLHCAGLEPGRKLLLPPGLPFWYYIKMTKSIKVVPKKRRGRPATGRDPVTAIRLSAELRDRVDKWGARQDDAPGRSEAIRRLVEAGLKAPSGAKKNA
jgi:hypothetical protein